MNVFSLIMKSFYFLNLKSMQYDGDNSAEDPEYTLVGYMLMIL